MIVAIEGMDGVGKTTIAKNIEKDLNFKYIKGRRVGGSYFLIKKCLFSSKLHLSTKNLVYFSY